VKLKFVTDHQYGTNVGSRLYMLDESGEKYKMFYLKNREFAMTFDVSEAQCGMSGAMYFAATMTRISGMMVFVIRTGVT